MNADAPHTPAERFLALIRPAAQRAGYLDYGGRARLARDTGITDSTISRMLKGQSIPEVAFFEPLAKALDLSVLDLLVAAGIVSGPSLSETHPSRVRSVPTTPEEAADALGITSREGVEMFLGVVERLRRGEADEPRENDDEATGGQVARRQ